MEGDPLRLETENLCDRRLVDGLKLRAGPHFGAVAIDPDRSVQRLHWRMRQVGEFELSNDLIRSGNALNRLRVPTGHRAKAGGAGELFVPRAQLRTVGPLYTRKVPIDFQPVTSLLRRPELIGHNGHTATFYEGNLEDVPHTFNAASCRGVKTLDPRPKGRRVRDHRHLH